MNRYKLLAITLTALMLTGCAGLFVAGAATTVNLVTDPRSGSELLKDQQISLNATALGNKAPFLSHVRLSTSSFRGKVLLMGQAETQAYKDQVAREVRKIDGVTTIYNQLRVRPLLSMGEVSQDVWLTTKVKSALLANEQLREVKISVYSEDSEVFLVGAVSADQAATAVDIARNISGVKQVIKAFYQATPPATPVAPVNPAPVQSLNQAEQQTVKPSTQDSQGNSEVIPFRAPVEEISFSEENL